MYEGARHAEAHAAVRETGESATAAMEDFLRALQQAREEEGEAHPQPWARSLLRASAEAGARITGRATGPWLLYPAVRRVFRSDAEIADLLGVSRSRIARWKTGQAADPENEARLRDLAVVVLLLTDYLEEPAIRDWLFGTNPHLSHQRPVDLLMLGRLSEVVRALEAEKAGALA